MNVIMSCPAPVMPETVSARRAFGVVALVGGWFGQQVVTGLVRRYQSSSLVVLALGTMVGLANVLLTIIGIDSVVRSLRESGRIDLAFTSPCDDASGSARPFM